MNNASRGRQVFNHYSVGTGCDSWQHLLSLPQQEARDTVAALRDDGHENDVLDNIGEVLEGRLAISPKRKYVQRKRRRLENLPSVRRGFAKRKDKRAGQWCCLFHIPQMFMTRELH